MKKYSESMDIYSLLKHQATTRPVDIALEEPSTRTKISYEELFAKVVTIALYLKDLGEKRVAIVMPNGSKMSCALLAATISGTALPFNPKYKEAEFNAYFQETGISSLLTTPGCSIGAENAARKIGVPILNIETIIDSAITNSTEELKVPEPDDIALVLLTSGSTGRAKSVPLSHRNVCYSASTVSESMSLGPDDRCLSMWELFHIGGLVDLLLAPLFSGGTVITTSGFNTKLFFDLIGQTNPTWYQAVPTTLAEINSQAEYLKLKSIKNDLRLIRSVAAALPPTLMAKINKLFSIPVIQTFGMTEAGPLITSTMITGKSPSGSVGVSCGTEIAIFNQQWSKLSPDIEGEVAIRGDNVFTGYESDPEANTAAFRDGWFRTGDIGYVDRQGNLFLTGRIKELINRGGEKLNMQEVDNELQKIMGVKQAACFAIPHPSLGEDIAAAIVSEIPPEKLLPFIRKKLSERLSPFKIPRQIVVLDELPYNAIGKIDRKKLRDNVLQHLQSQNVNKDGISNETELKIARIWGNILNTSDIAPKDDFISLGGDSLGTLRMLMMIEDEFDKHLPIDQITTRVTSLKELATVVLGSPNNKSTFDYQESMDRGDYRKMVTLMAMGKIPARKDGSLFKVLNEGGTRSPIIWFFPNPAESMGKLKGKIAKDQPLYGGFTGGTLFKRDDTTLKRIALSYVAEIKDFFPNVDVVIGGNCLGGNMGWWVTKLLLKDGIKVKRLCFLEFSHPELVEFNSDMLLMYGRHSIDRRYQSIHWGKSGWEKPFKVKPIVAWLDGVHGRFFEPSTIDGFIETLEAFLADKPLIESTLDSPSGRRTMCIHQKPVMFRIYLIWYKLTNIVSHIGKYFWS